MMREVEAGVTSVVKPATGVLDPKMRIVQAVFGVFHHFGLASELYKRGHLECIYSTFPWQRLKRESLPRDKVKTFPWIHTPLILLTRRRWISKWVDDELGLVNAKLFDEWTARNIPSCDAFVGISGAGLKTGQLVQQRGGRYICDRGSTHIRFQDELVTEELQRWGSRRRACDPRDIAREEEQYDVADLVTVPSSHSRRTYIELGIPADKVRTIPYGMSLTNFYPDGEPPTDRFEVLFVGAVGLHKGVPYLLQAFAKVKHPNKRLRIVGDMIEDFKAVLPGLPQEYVEFTGRMPREGVRKAMSTSHVLVLPSIDEGLALVQGEAMACGCPVIATTNTGAEDLFTDGVEGFILPIRDVDGMAERMQQLADDPALRARMSEAGLLQVKSLGGWSTYGDQWEALLHQLTGK